MNFVDLDTYLEADAALRKVRDLHQKVPCSFEACCDGVCVVCRVTFPCETAQAIQKKV